MERTIVTAEVLAWIKEKEQCTEQEAKDLFRKWLGEEHAAMLNYVAELILTDNLGEIKEAS